MHTETLQKVSAMMQKAREMELYFPENSLSEGVR